MAGSNLIGVLIVAIVIAIVLGAVFTFVKMGSIIGYNLGRNYLHKLGFSDEDINPDQYEEERDMYDYRRSNEKEKRDTKY